MGLVLHRGAVYASGQAPNLLDALLALKQEISASAETEPRWAEIMRSMTHAVSAMRNLRTNVGEIEQSLRSLVEDEKQGRSEWQTVLSAYDAASGRY